MMHIQKVIRAGYKRHLGVGMFNLLSLSLSLLSRLAHGPCAYCNAFVMFYAPHSMSPDRPAECDDEAGRLRRQREAPGSLCFDQSYPNSHCGELLFTVIHYKRVSVAFNTTEGGVATYLRNEPGKTSLFFLTAHHPRILHAWSLLGIGLRGDADACVLHRLSVRFEDMERQFKRLAKDPQQRSWNPLVFVFFPRSSGHLILPGPQPEAHDIALPTLVNQ